MEYELLTGCGMQAWPSTSPHPSLCVDNVLIRAVMVRWCVTWHTDTVIYAKAKRILLHVYCHLAVVNALRCRCNVVESQSGYQICYRTYINVVKVHYTPILNKRF